MNPKKTTVGIGEAAALTGTTPTAIRHQHRSGLLPEPEPGPDGRGRYGYEDLVRLLWARRMTELRLPPEEVRAALDPGSGPEDLLARLAAAVRARGRQPEADHLLGPEVARVEAAGRHLLALHPRLRTEQERLESELAALAGAEADDPRVERLAHDWFVHIRALEAAERAVAFPEADFTDVDATETGAGGPSGPPGDASVPLPGEMSPAQARVAELLDALLAAHPTPDRET
ncbi:MerR family transcriptional regulator [Streptomyces sp. NPDC051211]|uniref:MerR family transcriptional regulator n=1 Tax=Streptomyces sp. NPDC051211 TaxID=3154643 RepID=UPI00344E8DBB